MATRNHFAAFLYQPGGSVFSKVAQYNADNGAFIQECYNFDLTTHPGNSLNCFTKSRASDNLYLVTIAKNTPGLIGTALDVFLPDGTPVLTDILLNSDYPGLQPWNIDVPDDDHIYVMDFATHEITPGVWGIQFGRWDSTGTLIDTWDIKAPDDSNFFTLDNNGFFVLNDIVYWTAIDNPLVLHRYDLIGDAALSDLVMPINFFGSWLDLLNDESFATLDGGGLNIFNILPLDGSLLATYTGYGFAVIGNFFSQKGINTWSVFGGDYNMKIGRIGTAGVAKSYFPGSGYPGSLFSTKLNYIDGPDVPGILNLSIDCATKNIIIDGVGFPDSPTITLYFNGTPVPFTTILVSPTQIIIHPDTFQNGNWCALVQ